MKKMAQIKEMSDPELKSAVSELAKEKYNLKMQAKTVSSKKAPESDRLRKNCHDKNRRNKTQERRQVRG